MVWFSSAWVRERKGAHVAQMVRAECRPRWRYTAPNRSAIMSKSCAGWPVWPVIATVLLAFDDASRGDEGAVSAAVHEGDPAEVDHDLRVMALCRFRNELVERGEVDFARDVDDSGLCAATLRSSPGAFAHRSAPDPGSGRTMTVIPLSCKRSAARFGATQRREVQPAASESTSPVAARQAAGVGYGCVKWPPVEYRPSPTSGISRSSMGERGFRMV